MRSREITYLMSGIAHMPYLVVSLRSLREWWDGPVVVYVFPESREIGRRVAQDGRLGVEIRDWEPIEVKRRTNIQFVNKIKVLQEETADSRIYLDADTTIHGKLEPLFEIGEDAGFAATQFSLWLSTGGVIKGRIKRLLQFPEIPEVYVKHVMTHPYPSPNGGIFACSPRSPILPRWFEWSMIASTVFIADEAVLHVLQAVMSDRMVVVRGGRWNCSHKYQDDIVNPIIYHYHGDSNVRPTKSPRAYAMWWPLWLRAIDDNLGGAAEWGPRAVAENKHMRKLENA